MIQILAYTLFTVLVLYIVKNYLDKKNHPKGLFYLFFAEMWERFSFYGMRALLTLYLIKDFYSDLQNSEEIAYGIYAAYGALVYLTPLVGGYLADKFIGYRKSIIFGGILMALGHFFMSFPSDFFFYGALGLLIIGNGFFKPNISTMVGSLYEDGDVRRDSGFTIFYMGINLGAMIAPLFCGYLGETYGWHYGFGAAGIGMVAGLLVFWRGISKNVLGNKGLQPEKYINIKFNGISVTNLIYLFGFLSVPVFAYLIILDTKSAVLGNVLSIVGGLVLIYVSYIIYDYKVRKNDNVSGDRLIAIIILAAFLTIFWACFEQAGSSLTVWVDKCVNLVGLNASQTNAINPAYIVLLAIPFSWLWTKLGAIKKNPNTTIKFALGILQLGLGFLIFALTAHFIGENGKVPFLFVFLGYFLITTGELFLSPIGLSKVTELSPKRMIGFMMGVWFLSSTFAHYISGGIAKMTSKPFYNEFMTFAVYDNDKNLNLYDFELKFDYQHKISKINMIKEIDNLNNKIYYGDSLFTKKDKKEISKLISLEIVNNADDFIWQINNKGLLTLKLKNDSSQLIYDTKTKATIDKIKTSFITGEDLVLDKDNHKNIFEKIASKLDWQFLKSTENKNINESYMTPNFDNLKNNLFSFYMTYSTNESIKNKKDAIAGINYISNKQIKTDWTRQKNLSPGTYTQNFISADGSLNHKVIHSISEGPSDFLSKITSKLLGNRVIDNKPIATLVQYNSIYAKIGIVTIIMSLFVILISPFIKKLMHGIH